jgi:hypothetical protein
LDYEQLVYGSIVFVCRVVVVGCNDVVDRFGIGILDIKVEELGAEREFASFVGVGVG